MRNNKRKLTLKELRKEGDILNTIEYMIVEEFKTPKRVQQAYYNVISGLLFFVIKFDGIKGAEILKNQIDSIVEFQKKKRGE